ncbi:hypothetical protein [Chryseolinea lacunae]|uniref:DUF4825 domain-containing protein n=1 Tax=Chryseolinea lacunae TaxID=2801331 RepID=A0ABS1KSX5_9BACT|nr:hypothetical protein [Chryseolinea lacunae]MBL0742559.1 hypothetical protein [Chryseolinea lacunae]
MRKTLTIVLTLLLLLNVMGYYGVFMGLSYKNSQDLMARFDSEDYGVQETVTLKVPLAVPYAMDNNHYERVDGELEHDGEVYRLVKQRLSQDTLYIVCYKDNQSKRINQALADYVKTFTDKPVDAKSHSKIFQNFIKDYISSAVDVESATGGWENLLSFFSHESFYSDSNPSLIKHPPRA